MFYQADPNAFAWSDIVDMTDEAYALLAVLSPRLQMLIIDDVAEVSRCAAEIIVNCGDVGYCTPWPSLRHLAAFLIDPNPPVLRLMMSNAVLELMKTRRFPIIAIGVTLYC